MVAKESIYGLAKALLGSNPASLRWDTPGEESYGLDLGEVRLVIKKALPQESVVKIEVNALSGRNVGAAEFRSGEDEFEDVSKLYKAAQKSSAWTELVDEIAQNLQKGTDAAFPPKVQSPPSPPVPRGPTSEQEQTLFQKIAGKWRCEYPTGSENVEITSKGEYFTHQLILGREGIRSSKPKFKLKLNWCNGDLTLAEISKVLPEGRTFQIEVLQLSELSLEGYAKHDEHSVVYTKILTP